MTCGRLKVDPWIVNYLLEEEEEYNEADGKRAYVVKVIRIADGKRVYVVKIISSLYHVLILITAMANL